MCSSLLLAVLVNALFVGAQAQWGNLPIVTKPHRNVCVWPYSGLDICGPQGTMDFTGYEPEVFKRVASIVASSGDHDEWVVGKWAFSCINGWTLTEVVDATANGTCDVAMGGIESDEVLYSTTTMIGLSTYQAGRRILLYRQPAPYLWAFMEPFELGVWLLMFGSAVAVGVCVQLLEASWPTAGEEEADEGPGGAWVAAGAPRERGAVAAVPAAAKGGGGDQRWQQQRQQRKEAEQTSMPRRLAEQTWQRFSNVQFSSLGLVLVSVNHLSPRSPGAQLAVLGSAFASLLLACMYTSAYSASMTVDKLKVQVTNISDLVNLPVGIYAGDASVFQSFPLQYVTYLNWTSLADEEAMMDDLRDGRFAALIIDAMLADYHSSISCDLYEVGSLILPTGMGFLFSASLPDTYVTDLNDAVQQLQDASTLSSLAATYVRPNTCPPASALNYPQITLYEVGGLFVILASCLGLGLAWNLAVWALRRVKWPSRPPNGPPAVSPAAPTVKPPPNPTDETAAAAAGLAPESGDNQRSSGAETDETAPTPGSGVGKLPKGAFQAGARQVHGSFPPPPATTDEALLDVHARLDKLEQVFDSLPHVLSASLDDRLTALRVELAASISRTRRPKPGPGGGLAGFGMRESAAGMAGGGGSMHLGGGGATGSVHAGGLGGSGAGSLQAGAGGGSGTGSFQSPTTGSTRVEGGPVGKSSLGPGPATPATPATPASPALPTPPTIGAAWNGA